jgi:hypothetical protein
MQLYYINGNITSCKTKRHFTISPLCLKREKYTLFVLWEDWILYVNFN